MNVNALFYGAAPPRVGKLLCGTLHFLLPGGGHPNMNRREFITPLGGDDPARDCSESAFNVAGIASIDTISTVRPLKPPTRKSYRSKSTLRARGLNRSSRIDLEDLSRPADARQQPSHGSVVRLAAAALKLVLLDGPFGEGRGLICRLSLVLRKRHPLANDFPTRLVVFHVCGSLGCNFSTRLEATASFTVSRNSSGLVHAIRTASMWRRDFHRQNVVKPARCHRRMVFG